MSETTQGETEAAPAPASRVFKIKVAKAGVDLDVIWNELSDEVKAHAIEHGLGKLLNAATAKVTKTTQPDPAKLKAEALALANKKLDALKAGQIGRKKAKGPSGKAMTEARRQAKIIVKAAIKEQGGKVGDYAAAEITELANEYIADNPEIVKQAEEAIAKAEASAAKGKIDLSKLKPDPKKVAKREARNAEARAITADKAAGKPGPQKSATAVRTKPGVAPAAKPRPQPGASA